MSLHTELRAGIMRLRLLLPAFLLLLSFSLHAQTDTIVKKLPSDSVKMDVKQPSKSTQEDYYNDDYWKYDRDKEKAGKEEPGVFDRILERFLNKFFKGMGSEESGGSNFWSIFWLLVLIAIVVFAILKITNSGISNLFSGRRKKSEEIDASLDDVDIHAIDYEQMIAEALAKKDYRLGVRLWFLRTLKNLSDKELLHWKIDKTNSDYFYELSGTVYQDGFGKVSFIYDFIWYGEFPVDENSYREAEEKFREFQQTIGIKK